MEAEVQRRYACKACDTEVDASTLVTTKRCPACGSNEFTINVPPGVALCDFCSATPVTHAYPARDFRQGPDVPGAPGLASRGWWASCAICHRFIERGDRTGLALRSAKRLMKKDGPSRRMGLKFVISQVRRIHDNFWANREGPALEHLEVGNGT